MTTAQRLSYISKHTKELANLLEVVRIVAIAHGRFIEEVESTRATKAEKRGEFQKKLLLKEVRIKD